MGVGQEEVDEPTVSGPADAIDSRDERELVGGRVVRAGGLGAHARVEPGGDDIDDRLVFTRWSRIGDVAVPGGLAKVSTTAACTAASSQ